MELFSTDYPIYSVNSLGDSRFYVTGGGGQSKTGVPNALDAHVIKHDGMRHFTRQVCHHDLGPKHIMQSELHPFDETIAGSANNMTVILSLKEKAEADEKEDNEEESDKNSEGIRDVKSSDGDHEVTDCTVTEVGCVDSEGDAAGCQKVVRFACDGDVIITGGEDRNVRVWKYPQLTILKTLSAHKEEITDIACHPTQPFAVSVSRDGVAIVWQLETYKQEKEFDWHPHGQDKYRFRLCCFSTDDSTDCFYSINIPIKWNRRSRQYSYLVQWNYKQWRERRRVRVGPDMLTALTTSRYDDLIGVGDGIGTVYIYTQNLKPLMKVAGVHASIITDLSFVEWSDEESDSVTNKPALLSVSVDRKCCIAVVKSSKSNTLFLLVLLTLLVAVIAVVYTQLV